MSYMDAQNACVLLQSLGLRAWWVDHYLTDLPSTFTRLKGVFWLALKEGFRVWKPEWVKGVAVRVKGVAVRLKGVAVMPVYYLKAKVKEDACFSCFLLIAEVHICRDWFKLGFFKFCLFVLLFFFTSGPSVWFIYVVGISTKSLWYAIPSGMIPSSPWGNTCITYLHLCTYMQFRLYYYGRHYVCVCVERVFLLALFAILFMFFWKLKALKEMNGEKLELQCEELTQHFVDSRWPSLVHHITIQSDILGERPCGTLFLGSDRCKNVMTNCDCWSSGLLSWNQVNPIVDVLCDTPWQNNTWYMFRREKCHCSSFCVCVGFNMCTCVDNCFLGKQDECILCLSLLIFEWERESECVWFIFYAVVYIYALQFVR